MKRILGLALILAAFFLPLIAANNSQGFLLPSAVRVGDAQLPEGHCNVTWTQPAGSQVQLTIKIEGKTVTVPARVVEEKSSGVAVQTYVANGVTYVKEFDTKTARFIVEDAAAKGTK